MENYTYKSLGFENIKAIIQPKRSANTKMYDTLGIKEPSENIKKYLVNHLVEYVKSKKNGNTDNFVAGIAYMMDNSAIMVYNGNGVNRSKLYSVHIEEVDCGGEALIDYIAGYVCEKKPDGLILLQEIEPVVEGEYHFRIVHETSDDKETMDITRIHSNEKESETKVQLIEMLIRRLIEYNGMTEFSPSEIEEIMAILNLLDCLDPKGKYLKASSNKISFGISHGESRQTAKIIDFSERKNKR